MHIGIVSWFDGLSGEGMVRDNATGKLYFLHFTAIEGVSKNNYHWPSVIDKDVLYNLKGKVCQFTLVNDPTFVQIETLKLI